MTDTTAEKAREQIARLESGGLWPDDKAIYMTTCGEVREIIGLLAALTASPAQGEWISVPREPTEAMWGLDGLARSIMMWLDVTPHTPRSLFQHLERSGKEIPDWLRNEPEMKALDHVPSKATRCVLIYKAMLEFAPVAPSSGKWIEQEADCSHCGGVGDIDNGDHSCMTCGGSGKVVVRALELPSTPKPQEGQA